MSERQGVSVKVDCVSPDRTPGELLALREELVHHDPSFHHLAAHCALLASESRLKILSLLECVGELCVCDLATVLAMTPAAVSQHLSRLRSGGLVGARRDGMTVYYRLLRQPWGLPEPPPGLRHAPHGLGSKE